MKGDDVICVGTKEGRNATPLKWFQPSEPETGTETRTRESLSLLPNRS